MCQHVDPGILGPDGSSMYAFIGLGNPGIRYVGTRHNAGFDIIDTWLQPFDLEISPVSDHFNSVVTTIGETKVALIKPMTFMNRSGLAVKEAIEYYELDLDRIVVVCDDVNLAFGTLRLRLRGSHGGHRGLESIIKVLGTDEFVRQRIGVDVPRDADTLIDYVLEEFEKEEVSDLPFVLERACNQLELFVSGGFDKAASRYNGPSIADEDNVG